MNRNGGLIAGMLVVLMVLGVSNLPRNSGSPGTIESRKSASPLRRNVSGPEPQSYRTCIEIADRLQRFINAPSGSSTSWKLPGSCYKAGQAPNALKNPHASPGVQFAIAILPNPISTHLALFFDRIVQAIQQAAQDELYSYDDSLFPWEATIKDYSSLIDQQAAEELQRIQLSQPGVMVFRQGLVHENDPPPYGGGLIVFLVGEKPTGGINDNQFDNALAWMAQFGGISDNQPLRILGPTFSGSLPSLQGTLDKELTSGHLKGYKGQLWVLSGTVSSGLSYEWFKTWITNRHDGSVFITALENDSLMTDRFCQYLREQGYLPQNVAFLSEDETAFGGSQQKYTYKKQSLNEYSPCAEALQFYYPRDIATLRSAYEQQAILVPTKPQSNANAPSTTLRADLTEPSSSDHDTVRSYGGQLTPLAQESVLLDIANQLSEKHIQFIILRSTGSLDQIFLSEFLRRAYPAGRVVIDGADLLFTRGAEGRSLRGVMLLSTYPLLTLERDWTPSLRIAPTKSYRMFGEDASEGVYVSARDLFRNKDQTMVPIYDYTPPRWAKGPNNAENNLPATWLTVIGHRQFWPLAALNSNTLGTVDTSTEKSILASSPDVVSFEPILLRLPSTMSFFLIACAAWSALHAYFCWRGSIVGSPRARAYFAPITLWQHPALIAFGSLLLAMLAIVVAATSGIFAWPTVSQLYGQSSRILLAISALSLLALSTLACVANYRLTPSCASDSRTMPITTWRHRAGWMAVLCLEAFAAIHIYLVHRLTRANSVPTYWRSVNLLSGVSPLLPQALFIAGAYLWFWCTLRGLAHFGDGRPLLPKCKYLPKLDDGTPAMPMFSREKAGDQVEEAARPLTKSYLIRLIVVVLISAGVCFSALQGLSVRVLGERAFGTLIFVSLSLCIAVIIADGIQMWLAWSELRRLLVFLDRLSLRRTLRALKGLAWGSIWKLSGNVLEERYRVISLQFESLRHLKNTLEGWAPGSPCEAEDRSKVLAQIDKCREKGMAFARWYVRLPERVEDVSDLHDFQEELAKTAGLLMTRVLVPAWQKEKESLIFDRSKLEETPEEDEEDQTAIPPQKLAPHVRTAEEFFVLPYLAFIQNILGRLRTIALGSLWLFVGATFAVSSYPFDPPNVLGGIFLGVFLVIGGLSVLVYAQMSRDATLSHITNRRPGRLGMDFWIRLVAFGIGPLIGLLTTLFPSITDFAFSWLEPGIQALK